jgi:esterase/lipase
VEDSSARTLASTIWELQQVIDKGGATARTRRMLLRAHADEIAHMEDGLGIDPADRAFLLVNEDSRDGVLLVHDSDGSPRDLKDLAESLHGAGYSVLCLRLPGTGLAHATAQAGFWQSASWELEQRYQQLSDCCKNVSIVGHGFGATLAMQIENRLRPAALALLAPALYPRLGFWNRLLTALGLDRFEWFRKRMDWPSDMVEAMASARKKKWWYQVPVYIAVSRDDELVDPRGLGFVRSRLTHHRSVIKSLDDGGHEFHTGSHRDEIRDDLVGFFSQNRSR